MKRYVIIEVFGINCKHSFFKKENNIVIVINDHDIKLQLLILVMVKNDKEQEDVIIRIKHSVARLVYLSNSWRI